ncbi:MAG: FtsX-like permease family protein, partial [Lentisphaerae bacterium]|nr:FtsX-like permease family protein [Lentisphaerota bacterium]
TGTDAAWLHGDLGDDGVVVNRWLADDLACGPGDTLDIRYLAVGPLQALEERRAALSVRAVVPMAMPYADPGLMPAIPGLGDAERCTDWSPGIPIDLQRIRPQDEAYWAEWRGTPKAFVSLATAQRLWSNRFGASTAVHLPLSASAAAARLRAHLEPSQVGLVVLPVRREGLRAAGQAVDFAQLFLGLSFFLIAAGLLLTGLLAGLAMDRRHEECGTLLALGFTPTRVRRLLLAESLGLAVPATLLGVGLGLLYNRAVVAGLGRLWRDSLGGLPVQAYASARSLLLGGLAASAATALVLVWVLHRLGRRQAALLQRGSPVTPLQGRRPWRWFASGCLALGAGAALAWLGQPERGQAAAGVFFGAGALLLVGGLFWVTAALQGVHRLGPGRLSLRNAARRPARSLAVSATLASAVFLVVAVGAHRRVVPDGDGARAGTGGFAFYGETAVPILADLNSAEGRRRLRLEAPPSDEVRVLHLFAADGDEASCLNLNRTRQPRLLGVEPAEIARQAAFGFARMLPEVDPDDPWAGLDLDLGAGVVPAIVDESVLVWNFGLRLGDTLTLADSRGRPLHLRFVATLSGSILQGHVLMAAGRLREGFPEAGGARVLLVQSPPAQAAAAAAWLLDGLADHGLELTPSRERLAAFAAVENTYLAIFMALGGLGLVLGCFGLGAVVVRHVVERRGEMALLRALGFSRRALLAQVLVEHAALLSAGLAVGLVSGLVAVLPAVTGGGTAPLRAAALWCLGIAFSGLAWILAAAWWSTRSRLIEGLRDE